MTTDPNEGPVWPSENPSDRPTPSSEPSSEPVYPPSAANEPPPPPEQAAPEPPGTYPPPPPPPPAYGGAPQGYPPPPPPGYAAPGYGAQAVTQAPVPAGLNGLWQKFINVTTKPGAQSFANELPTANWSDIWLAIIGLGVLTGITGFITSFYTRTLFTANNPFFSGMPPDQQHALNSIFSNAGPSFGSLIGPIIGVPLGFFIGMGILFVSAKIFGGAGSFLEQAYSFMLFYVPINGLGAILGLVPILGGFAGFLLWIYSIVLAVFAMMASQRLPGGRAVAAVLLPAIVVALLVCAFLFIAIAAIAALINGTR
jgi:Yip1-like protein